MMKIKTIATGVCFGVTSSLFAADSICTNKNNEFKKAFDAAATAMQLVINYELAHWVDQSVDFTAQDVDDSTTCTSTSAEVACTTVRDNALLKSIAALNDTGAIVLTFNSSKDINALLRGATITMTPKKCETQADSTQVCVAYTARTTENSGAEATVSENNNPPSGWDCKLTGPQSDFRNFTLNSVTCNFIEQSNTGMKDNYVKDLCASGLNYTKA